MKKLFLLPVAFCILLMANSQASLGAKEEALTVSYLERVPFAYTVNKSSEPEGIEIDIIREFVKWATEKKGKVIKVTYAPSTEFESFFTKMVTSTPDVIGCGNATITEERKKSMGFSAPYLNNISVLISEGTVPTLDNFEEMKDKFKGMIALTTKGSVHEGYINELKKYVPDLKVEYVNDQNLIPQQVIKDKRYFGYVDIISYWNFYRTTQSFVKMHRIADKTNEKLGFIFPPKSDWQLLFSEFFESGFGFTSTRKYEAILEKYLGFEVIGTVAVE